jgi:hypothetical protein
MSTALTLVTHVRRRERKGSSSPVVADTTDGMRFVKLHGASQGSAPLVAEIIVGALGDALGLSVPARALVELPHGVPSDDQNDELRDLLDASAGTNLGFEWLEGARDLGPGEFATANLVVASRVLWLDMLVQNLDRTPRNANLMMRRGTIWLIDHGACLPFQHDWSNVTESHPSRAYDVAGHVFGWAAPVLPDVHAHCAPLMTRELLRAAVLPVPDAWMGGDAARRREGVVAYLWKRLAAMPQLLPLVQSQPSA